MGAKVTFNELTRTIEIDEAPDVNGDVNIDVKVDLYSDGKEDWVANESLRKVIYPLSAVGGNPLPGGRYLGDTFFIRSDWKIAPYEADHRLIVDGNLYSEDGEDPFLDTAGAYTVRVLQQVSSLVDAITADVGNIAAEVKDAVWDEPLTGLTHNVQHSAGKMLRELAGKVIQTGTAQGAGTNSNQIQLAADASTLDGAYDPAAVAIVDGTGAGQIRLILEYDGSTRMATVDRTWKVNPDNTSEYIIYANPGREHVNEGLAQGGTSDTITLNALASSVDNAYKNQIIFIRSGTGEDQARRVLSYVGSTRIATICHNWDTTPDTTSAYVMLPNIVLPEEVIADEVWTSVLGAEVRSQLEYIKDVESGRWKMENDQMIFYKADNMTEVVRFNLYNQSGSPAMENIYERERDNSSDDSWKYPQVLEMNIGSIQAGALADIVTEDTNRLQLNEITTDGFDYVFFFEAVGDINLKVDIVGYYQGNPAHNVKIYIHNLLTHEWEALTVDANDFPSNSTDQNYSFNLPTPRDTYRTTNGDIRLKIKHVSSGTPGHYLWINQMELNAQ